MRRTLAALSVSRIAILINSTTTILLYHGIIVHKRVTMHMWFWFGSNLGEFLLPGYYVTTTASFFCTCLGLFALAILYESMKILQIKLKQNTVPQSTSVSEGSCLLSKILTRSIGPNASIEGIRWPAWCFQVFHWSIHTFLSYLLMLAVMTYNVYVNVVIVLGGCLGYWIFGPRLIELNMKQFHDKQRLLDCDKECAEHIMNEERRGSTISIVAEQLVTETTVEVHVPGTI